MAEGLLGAEGFGKVSEAACCSFLALETDDGARPWQATGPPQTVVLPGAESRATWPPRCPRLLSGLHWLLGSKDGCCAWHERLCNAPWVLRPQAGVSRVPGGLLP